MKAGGVAGGRPPGQALLDERRRVGVGGTGGIWPAPPAAYPHPAGSAVAVFMTSLLW